MLSVRVVPLVLLAAVTLAAQDTQLLAGLARVEITPTTFGPMYGYSNRKCGPATGVHDPLFAKVLVLQAGDARMAIVTMDLGSFASTSIFKRVEEELKIPLLLIAPSHTHSAPAFLPSSLGTKEPSPYLAELEEKVFGAVKQAAGAMFPAKLGLGRGSIQLGYNRLLMRDDGRARALFDNLERVPYGPVDPELILLRVSDLEDRTRALMVHYTAHPVTQGPTNCLYSADYPGVVKARIEAAMPGAQAMFVQGAAGSTNPLFQGRTGNSEADFATMNKMGNLLADEVLRAAKEIRPLPAGPASIAFRTKTLPFESRWVEKKPWPVGITTVLISGQIAIATVPGEPFLGMQTRWKQAADAPYALLYGYTQTTSDPWPGYIPDIRSAAFGGYGANASTNIEVGAAERIMDQHLIHLYDLKNLWVKEPGRP